MCCTCTACNHSKLWFLYKRIWRRRYATGSRNQEVQGAYHPEASCTIATSADLAQGECAWGECKCIFNESEVKIFGKLPCNKHHSINLIVIQANCQRQIEIQHKLYGYTGWETCASDEREWTYYEFWLYLSQNAIKGTCNNNFFQQLRKNSLTICVMQFDYMSEERRFS